MEMTSVLSIIVYWPRPALHSRFIVSSRFFTRGLDVINLFFWEHFSVLVFQSFLDFHALVCYKHLPILPLIRSKIYKRTSLNPILSIKHKQHIYECECSAFPWGTEPKRLNAFVITENPTAEKYSNVPFVFYRSHPPFLGTTMLFSSPYMVLLAINHRWWWGFITSSISTAAAVSSLLLLLRLRNDTLPLPMPKFHIIIYTYIPRNTANTANNRACNRSPLNSIPLNPHTMTIGNISVEPCDRLEAATRILGQGKFSTRTTKTRGKPEDYITKGDSDGLRNSSWMLSSFFFFAHRAGRTSA